jgi:hypothetical protein
MSGMTTRSRRSPTMTRRRRPAARCWLRHPGSRAAKTAPQMTAHVRPADLLPASTFVRSCACHTLSLDVCLTEQSSPSPCPLKHPSAGAARPQEDAHASKLDLANYDVVNSPFIELGGPFTAWCALNI